MDTHLCRDFVHLVRLSARKRRDPAGLIASGDVRNWKDPLRCPAQTGASSAPGASTPKVDFASARKHSCLSLSLSPPPSLLLSRLSFPQSVSFLLSLPLLSPSSSYPLLRISFFSLIFSLVKKNAKQTPARTSLLSFLTRNLNCSLVKLCYFKE